MLFKDLSALLRNCGLQFEKVGADKELTYRVLGSRLRINDRKILETAYQTNIGSLEQKLMIAPEAIQAILDDTESQAKQIKAEDLIDSPLSRRAGKKRLLKAALGKVKV
ncbi:MAG TPA: hypothetical protein VGL70_07455 [Candidatus Binatia bacterium]|jgi:uncharacterized protein YxjI